MPPFRTLALLVFLAACSPAAHGFIINTVYDDPDNWTPTEQSIVSHATSDWTSRMSMGGANNQVVTLNFSMTNAGTGPTSYLAQYFPTNTANKSFPYSPGLNHFIDINADFLSFDYISLTPPTANDGYDMLSFVRHEIGHALGFYANLYVNGNSDRWASHIFDNVFDPAGLDVPMADDGVHVNLPDDLMYYQLAPGVRKDISNTDIQMLGVAFGFSALPTPEPASLAVLTLGSTLVLLRRRRPVH